MENIIGIGCDHAGYLLKEYLKKNLIATGYTVKDYGSNDKEKVDYPDIIHPLASDIDKGIIEKAVIVCGSGNGVAMTANKYINVRAALCWTPEIAKFARKHNDANIISLPARFIRKHKAWKILRIFLATNFEGGRHLTRITKIKNIIN